METKKTDSMTSAEIRERIQDLWTRYTNLENEKRETEENLAVGLSKGEHDEKYAQRVAVLDVELAATKRAVDLLGIQARRTEKKEKIEEAKTLSRDLMRRFETSVYPMLKEAMKSRFKWREEATLKFLKGEDNFALGANDPFAKISKPAMHEIVKALDEMTETAARPAPKEKPPKTFPEPPTPRPHGAHTVTRLAPQNADGTQTFVKPEVV